MVHSGYVVFLDEKLMKLHLTLTNFCIYVLVSLKIKDLVGVKKYSGTLYTVIGRYVIKLTLRVAI